MAVNVVYQDQGHPSNKTTPIRTFYEGLSTDIKPTDCNTGSEFRELDTGFTYKFAGTWLQWEASSSILSAMALVQARLDGWNNIEDYIRQIDYMHDHTHKGKILTTSNTQRAVAPNGVFGLLFTASATKETHISLTYSSEAKAYFQTYAGGTYTEGTSITPFNRKGSSSITYGGTVLLNPTVSVAGTLRGDEAVGSGGNVQTRAGGTSGTGIESVIAPNGKLYLYLQNGATVTSDLTIITNLYEETPYAG